MSWLGKIWNQLKQIPALKRLTDLPDRMDALEKRIAALESGKADDFTSYDGALFKRNPDGGWADAVFCPMCKISVLIDDQMGIVICSQCGWRMDFSVSRLHGILRSLPK